MRIMISHDRVASITTLGTDKGKRIEIVLVPKNREYLLSPIYGELCTGVHDTTKPIVRDLPILDARTYLIVPRRNFFVPSAGRPLKTYHGWQSTHA